MLASIITVAFLLSIPALPLLRLFGFGFRIMIINQIPPDDDDDKESHTEAEPATRNNKKRRDNDERNDQRLSSDTAVAVAYEPDSKPTASKTFVDDGYEKLLKLFEGIDEEDLDSVAQEQLNFEKTKSVEEKMTRHTQLDEGYDHEEWCKYKDPEEIYTYL